MKDNRQTRDACSERTMVTGGDGEVFKATGERSQHRMRSAYEELRPLRDEASGGSQKETFGKSFFFLGAGDK